MIEFMARKVFVSDMAGAERLIIKIPAALAHVLKAVLSR
jgi:hypothetical protein